MNLLGLNSAYHESSACLIQDGKLIAAAEEERFNRVKHGKPARVDNPQALPLQAIAYCLREGGIAFRDLDQIGFSFAPDQRLRNIGVEPGVDPGNWGTPAGEQRFHARLLEIPGTLQAAFQLPAPPDLQWLPHHLCHAASAFLVSPFADAAVLTVDGIGEFATTHLGHGQNHRITTLREINYPHSLGFLWEKLSRFLGFSEYDACKVMGLAAYGDARRYAAEFAQLVQLTPDGFTVSGPLLAFRQTANFAGLEARFGPRRRPDEPIAPRHQDVAAALQDVTERILLHLAALLHRETRSAALCLAGGVALNCVATQALQARGPFARVFVQPAAHDAGTAIGAACLLWHQDPHRPRLPALHTAYLGPAFSDAEIEQALRRSGLAYRRSVRVIEETAALLARGEVVAWFQGRMEFGPRALGNRSLLADPRDPHMREKLNHMVKHREPFRPFGPSVTVEAARDWFELPPPAGWAEPAEFMLSTVKIAPGRAARIPAVAHYDQTSRIQMVRPEANPRYHQLLRRFGELTGVPMLLNTSFNDREPIVCSPQDAIQTFCKTRIDHLVLGDYLATQPTPP